MSSLSQLHGLSPIVSVAALAVALVVLKKAASGLLKRGSDKPAKPGGGHWLWGHERMAWETPNLAWYQETSEKLGLTFSMKGALFHEDILCVADPGSLEHIFTKNTYNYTKSPVTRPLVDRLMGKGILWAEGDTHKRQRQSVAPLFTHPRIRTMEHTIRDLSDRFIQRLQDSVGPDPAKVDLLNWISKFTLDVIAMIGFGYDFQCGESSGVRLIRESWRTQTRIGMTTPGFLAPLVLRAFPWITSLPVKAIQAQGEVKTMLKRIGREMIEKRREAIDSGEEESRDLLGALMKKTNLNDEAAVDELLDQISTFIIAGNETAATTAALIFMELARDKKLQHELRQEVLTFQASCLNGKPTYDDYLGDGMPLLDAVIKEGLRVHPIASHTERVALEDDVLPLRYPVASANGDEVRSVRIKAGQNFIVSIYAANTHSSTWGSNGHSFDHTRWMNKALQPQQLNNGINNLMSFIEGPRICVGYRLALFELKVLISQVVLAFELQPSEEEICTMWSTTLQPYVAGQRNLGPQLPIILRSLNA